MQVLQSASFAKYKGCKGAKLTAKKNKVTDRHTRKVTLSHLELLVAAKKREKRGKKEEKKEKTDENSGHYVVCQKSTA